MGTKVLFAVLAHKDRPVVEHLVENLTTNSANSEVIVFNGGPNSAWLEGADFPIAESSRPLRYLANAPFHYLTMCEVAHRDFDCLVTLDWDMLLVKPGIERQLGAILESFAYIGTRLYQSEPWSAGDPDRYVWHWWDRYWSELLQAVQPYNVFNPGQVFRKDLVERFAADPQMPAIIKAVEAAKVGSMEEVIYPTRAVAMGVPVTGNPGSHGLVSNLLDADELELLAADPNVFLVHKIASAHQRAAIDRLLAKGADPVAAAERIALRPPISGTGRRRQIDATFTQLRRDLVSITRGP